MKYQLQHGGYLSYKNLLGPVNVFFFDYGFLQGTARNNKMMSLLS